MKKLPDTLVPSPPIENEEDSNQDKAFNRNIPPNSPLANILSNESFLSSSG